MKLQGLLLLSASLATLVAGCSQRETPTSPQTPLVSALAKDPGSNITATQQVVSGYLISYTGRTVANGQTTFGYSVTGIADAPALNQIVLQVPACAGTVVASSPNGGVLGSDQQSGLYGIKWGDVSVSNGQSQSFSVTFAGVVEEGFVYVAAKIGTNVSRLVLPGACQHYVVSGTVFVDPDSSGTRNANNEPGIIADVTVTLVDGNGNEQTALTDAAGYYAFKAFDGTYTLRIDASTPSADFNEDLADAFWATTPTTVTFSITGDSPNHDFGYMPKATEITADIALGVIPTTGKDRGYWTKLMRTASRGGTYDGYTPAAVLAFLIQIEGQYFPEPYQFTNGNEIREALVILTENPRDVLGLLYRELFVSELNDAAGLGLINDPDLQDVLLSWGEGIIVSNMTVAKTGSGAPTTQGKVTTPTIEEEALDLFNELNTRGGGTIPD